MGICLIILPFLLLIDVLWNGRKIQRSLGEAFLTASVIFGGLVAAVTEVLGFFHCLTHPSIMVFWLLVLLVVLGFWMQQCRCQRKAMDIRRTFGLLSGDEKLLVSLMVAYVSITGVIAYVAPPNTWDSMTYHMSRVMHWMQNQSVDHYPTAIDRQLFINPFSEYVILHFQLLAGSDRFANFVQWFSFIGCILGVSVIAKWLGADREGRIFSMAIVVSIPMAILQSTSTQTDLVVAYWGVCCVAFLVKWRATQEDRDWIGLSLGVGLLALTKTTGLFVITPFGVWALVMGFRRYKVKFLGLMLASAVIVLLLLSPFLLRNIEAYHNPLGATETVEKMNYLDAGYKRALSSVLLNIGLHLGTPSEKVNLLLEKGILAIHRCLEVKRGRYFLVEMSTSEDSAGNFWHLVLFCGVLFLLPWRKKKDWDLPLYAVVLVGGFMLQSIALGWSPWRSRYHTILFVLAAPLMACALGEVRRRRVYPLLIFFLMLTSLPWVLGNSSKPILSRDSIFTRPRAQQYFVASPDLYRPYLEAAEMVKARSVHSVGLIMGEDSWEYPFWVILDAFSNKIRMEHIHSGPAAAGAIDSLQSFLPDAIIASTPDAQPPRIVYNGIIYGRVISHKNVAVFFKEAPPVVQSR